MSEQYTPQPESRFADPETFAPQVVEVGSEDSADEIQDSE